MSTLQRICMVSLGLLLAGPGAALAAEVSGNAEVSAAGGAKGSGKTKRERRRRACRPKSENQELKVPLILPALQLSGTTEAEGEFRFGGMIPLQYRDDCQVLIMPELSARTRSGSGSLFELGGSRPEFSEWAGGAQLAFFLSGSHPVQQDEQAIDALRKESFEICEARCKQGKEDAFCEGLKPKLGAEDKKELAKIELRQVNIDSDIAAYRLERELLAEKLETARARLRLAVLEARKTQREASAALAGVSGKEKDAPAARLAEADQALQAAEEAVARADLGEFADEQARQDWVRYTDLGAELEVKQVELREAKDEARVLKEGAVPKFLDGWRAVSVGELCEQGQAHYIREEATNVDVRRSANHSPWFVSMGLRGGSRNIRYVRGEAFVDGEEVPPYEEVERNTGSLQSGISFAFIPPQPISNQGHWYIEAVAGYGNAVTTGSDTVQWCEPIDQISPSVNGGTVTGEGQQCSEALFGRARRTHSVDVGVWSGAVEPSSGWWRVSFGPRYGVSIRDDRTLHRVSLEAPVYFNLLNRAKVAGTEDKRDKEIKYKGIVRLAPRVTWTIDTADRNADSVKFLLVLDLLAQRNLFLYALDWF